MLRGVGNSSVTFFYYCAGVLVVVFKEQKLVSITKGEWRWLRGAGTNGPLPMEKSGIVGPNSGWSWA